MSVFNSIIPLGSKVTERNIDMIVGKFYQDFDRVKSTHGCFYFDFSDLEWISNQDLLVITGILSTILDNGMRFKVNFFKNESALHVDQRKARQVVQIWDVWKIYNILPNGDLKKYFDIHDGNVARLKERFDLPTGNKEIYERYGVTPFIALDHIQSYDDKAIRKMLNELYRLNIATNEILVRNNCAMPFENETISVIVTRELYENFLDHNKRTKLQGDFPQAYLSLSVKPKFNEKENTRSYIQNRLKSNFEDESLKESRPFFVDPETNEFKNQALLQFSFLDFGEGIPETLKEQYLKKYPEYSNSVENLDSYILAYAFNFDSSRHPIDSKYANRVAIPRGLFDLISIVRRFEGLLIARSNFGRILFDFSNGKSIEDALEIVGDNTTYFPGTLVSIYLPERDSTNPIDDSPITPTVILPKEFKLQRDVKVVSLFDLQLKFKQHQYDKDKLYTEIFKSLISELHNSKEGVTYIDFNGHDIDERITKKIIFFLLSDYKINIFNNVIAINSPPVGYLLSIKQELLTLSEVDRAYKMHPVPFVLPLNDDNELSIFWLGVFIDEDILKLNKLLMSDHDLINDDFLDPKKVIGHINYYDKAGNLRSIIKSEHIFKAINHKAEQAKKKEIRNLLMRGHEKKTNEVYLCNGNYYQYEYFHLFDVMTNEFNASYLAEALFEEIKLIHQPLDHVKFIAISASSQKLLFALLREGHIQEKQMVILDDYHQFETEEAFIKGIVPGDLAVLLCDVISTGFQAQKLQSNLKLLSAKLIGVGVLVDATDPDYKTDQRFFPKLLAPITSLLPFKIKKYKRDDIREPLIKGLLKVIRINPYTNEPIILSIHDSNYAHTVKLKNKQFIDAIDAEHVKVGYYKFNNLIHPYFFDMDEILRSDRISEKLLGQIFQRIDKKNFEVMFYPKRSGIKNLNFELLKNKILLNQNLKIIELDRFPTNEGWRFPHPSEYARFLSKNKHALILDDGSCSGDSIIQMLDEIAFLEVRSITLVSIIGRVTDHKREFFSRINVLRGKRYGDQISQINTRVYFGCHWHIPTYYIEESPMIKERSWLEQIAAFPNTPEALKQLAENILNGLSLKHINDSNSIFLLKDRPNKEKTLIKDTILKKEELGRMTSFLFYKEYFNAFDEFIVKYEKKKDSEISNQNLELICAVFLHEPYLYNKVKSVLPDLAETVELFVETILLGNPNVTERPKLLISQLHYEWENKHIIQLFFIVFEHSNLMRFLDSNTLVSILETNDFSRSDVSYLLFKMLIYFPLERKALPLMKYAGPILYAINMAIKAEALSDATRKQLKSYRSFVATLPYNKKDFKSMLSIINDNYDRVNEDANHGDSILVQHEIIQAQLELLSDPEKYDKQVEEVVLDIWDKITPFFEELLMFSRSFQAYFAICDKSILDGLDTGQQSLRAVHKVISDMIYKINPKTEVAVLQRLLQHIFSLYISTESKYYQIFISSTTPNIIEEFNKVISEISQKFKIRPELISIHKPEQPVGSVSVPLYYVKQYILKEIFKNFRHCDCEKEIEFRWHQEKNNLYLTIKNYCAAEDPALKGGGNGLVQLRRLKELPEKAAGFQSSTLRLTGQYLQEFRFKLA